MIPTIHIFALLIMCFCGLATNEQTPNQDECNKFKTFSGPSLLDRVYIPENNRCYVLFDSAMYDLAKRHCAYYGPDGMQGALIQKVGRNVDGTWMIGWFMTAFKILTKCTSRNEWYWFKERIRTSANPSYKVCEQACEWTPKQSYPGLFTKLTNQHPCSTTEMHKFICEYKLDLECKWPPWSSCSVTCGKGTQSRFRQPKTNKCEQRKQTQTCDIDCDTPPIHLPEGIGLPFILAIVLGSIVCVLVIVGMLSLLVWCARKRRAAAAEKNNQEKLGAPSDYESPMKNPAKVMVETDPQGHHTTTEMSQFLTVGAGPEQTLRSEELSKTERHKPMPIHSYSSAKYHSFSKSKSGTKSDLEKKQATKSEDQNVMKKEGNTKQTDPTKVTTSVKRQSEIKKENVPDVEKPNEKEKKMSDNKSNEPPKVTDQEKQTIVTQDGQMNDEPSATIETGSDANENQQSNSNNAIGESKPNQ